MLKPLNIKMMKRASLNMINYIKNLTAMIILIMAGFSANAQLSGTNYIDLGGVNFSGNPGGVPGKTYTSFTNACNALASYGVSGHVKFIVAAGTYNEQVTLNNIATASATSTITFEGVDPTTRIISYAPSSSTNCHVFQVNGGSYVNIRNLKILNMGTTYGIGIHLYGATTNINIVKCSVEFGTAAGQGATSNYFQGIFVANTNVVTNISNCGSYNAAAFNILIDSNRVIGGGYGISITTSGQNSASVSGITVSNNLVQGFGYYGIYHSNNRGISILYNTVIARAGANSYVGIGGCNGSTSSNQYYEYIGNKIYNAYSYGIAIWTQNPGGTPRNKMVNNLIHTTSPSAYGIKLEYEKNYDIWFNSLYMEGGTTTSSYGIYASTGTTYANNSIKNNNIAFMNPAAQGYAIYFNVTIDAVLQTNPVEYNNFYKANTASPNLIYNGGYIYSAANMKGQNGMNNVFFNQTPGFVSTSDLHYNTSLVPIYGDPTLGITDDCDREPRCLISPSIGGDESKYRPPTPNTNFSYPDTIYKKGMVEFLNPSSPTLPYTYKWFVNGVLRATSLNFQYSFSTSGTYVVSLVATIYCGASDSTGKSVKVIDPIAPPVADFVASTNFCKTGQSVYLTDLSANGPTQWQWDVYPKSVFDPNTGVWESTYQFVSSTNSNSQNPVLVLKYNGEYTVCLRATNNIGSDSICKSDFIITRQATNICSQFASNANFGVLYDEGGAGANYTNNMNCRFLITPCAPNLYLNIKSFNLYAGDYLRIYDGVDNTGIKLYDVNVFPYGLTGDKSISTAIPTYLTSTTGKIYMEYVTDAVNVASGFEIEWNGSPKTLVNPVANFTISDSNICKGRTYYFTNTSTGYGNKYYWDLDDDGTVDGKDVHMKFTYLSAAPVDAVLIAENCAGIDTIRKRINVLSPTTKPVVNFGADIRNPGTITDVVHFYDSSYRCADYWQWKFTPSTITFRNGTNQYSMNPEVSFNAVGCYNVKLIAGCNGNIDSLQKICYISALNYCTPVVYTYSRDIGISKVQISNLNNKSDITTTTYTNYSQNFTVDLFKSTSYNITIDRLTDFNDISIAVWIDYNRDGDFVDAGEKVAYTNANSGLTWTSTFLVPVTAVDGTTRMRIGTNYANLPNLPCGANMYGEYEDYLVNLQADHVPPVITLIGPSTVMFEAGYTYVDSGATAWDNKDGDITAKIKVTNPVNTSVPATYYVVYNVKDTSGNNAVPVTRTVIVGPDITKPLITLVGGDTVYIEVFDTFTEPGWTAVDLPWGTVLTSSVTLSGSVNTNVVGTYILTYSCTDAKGNVASKQRVVIVRDTEAPDVKLKGPNPAYVEVYSSYVDSGLIVTDNYCTTFNEVITQNVDTSKLGTYTYMYCVTDCNGNGPICVTRTVIVNDVTKPSLSFAPGEDTIVVEVYHQFSDPGLTYSDNYSTGLYPVISGTFYTNFPTGIPSALGFYTIIYSVEDNSGNIGTLARVINVVDTEAPVITLIGSEIVHVLAAQWQNYWDSGYVLHDNYYAPATITIDTIDKFTNSLTEGVYFMQYKATDGSGNIGYSAKRVIYVNGFSGVNDNNLSGYISMSPNPTSGIVNVNLNLPSKGNTDIRIYDLLGKEQMLVFSGIAQKKNFSLDLSNFAKGVYMVKFNYLTESYSQLLIIK